MKKLLTALLFAPAIALASGAGLHLDKAPDVQGDKALAWVRERNAETLKQIAAREDYAPTRTKLLEVLNSRDRIPMVARRGDWLYNLWQDADHKRGLWRRATLAEYRKPAPQWETVIDLDALGAAEKENWVWGGAECLGPDYRRCLVSLSRGGSDADVTREFDLVDKRFVDDGFRHILDGTEGGVNFIVGGYYDDRLARTTLVRRMRELLTAELHHRGLESANRSDDIIVALLGPDALTILQPNDSNPVTTAAIARCLDALERLATRAGRRYWDAVVAVGLGDLPADFAPPAQLSRVPA